MMKDPLSSVRPAPAAPKDEDLRRKYFEARVSNGAPRWDRSPWLELRPYLAGVTTTFRIDYQRELENPVTTGNPRTTLDQVCQDRVAATAETITLYWHLENDLLHGARHLLVVGERGVGKEVVAEFVATKCRKQLWAVNCAVLATGNAEGELFGVAGGAGFPDVPRKGKPGVCDKANGQVLFLDEFFVTEKSVQAKLLRLLQERTYVPLGGAASRKLRNETIIVAASNEYPDLATLERAQLEKQARADLIERFDEVYVMPPLRHRRDEILPLVERLAAADVTSAYAPSGASPPLKFSRDAATVLASTDYAWPGNVRELKHVIDSRIRLLRGAGRQDLVFDPEQFRRSSAEVSVAPGPVGPSEADPLSLWRKGAASQRVRGLREEQLLAYLTQRAREEACPEPDDEWVAQAIRKELGRRNASDEAKRVGMTCGQIAQKVRARLRAGAGP